ncbi:MAG: hypothetical protein AB1327_04325 [Bacillota bacterium]
MRTSDEPGIKYAVQDSVFPRQRDSPFIAFDAGHRARRPGNGNGEKPYAAPSYLLYPKTKITLAEQNAEPVEKNRGCSKTSMARKAKPASAERTEKDI